jgi:hypothetical protein
MKRVFFPRWFSLLFPFLFFCAAGDPPAGDPPKPPATPPAGDPPPGDPPKPTPEETAARLTKLEADMKRAARERDEARKNESKLNEQLAEYQRKEQERLDEERKKAEADEQDRLLKEKKFEEALEVHKKKSAEEITAERARTQSLADNYVRADLKAAVASTPNIVPEASEEIAALLAAQVGYEIKDNRVVPFVKGADGKPRTHVDEPTKPFEMSDLVKEFVAKRPYYLKASTGSGSGAGPGERLTSTTVSPP